MALIAGGWLGSFSTDSVYLYSPEGQCNIKLAPMPVGAHNSALNILNGMITLCGGIYPNNQKCWKYNSSGNNWTEISTSKYVHFRQPAIKYYNKLYYLNVQGQSEIFDGDSNNWTSWISPPKDHGAHPCLITWRDAIIAIGGADSRLVQMFNITTNTWKALSDNPLGNGYGLTCIQIPQSSNKYLIAGGGLITSIYDASSDTWRRVADAHFSKYAATAVLMGKRIFSFGGESGQQYDVVEEFIVDKEVWELKSFKLPNATAMCAAVSVPSSWFNSNCSTSTTAATTTAAATTTTSTSTTTTTTVSKTGKQLKHSSPFLLL